MNYFVKIKDLAEFERAQTAFLSMGNVFHSAKGATSSTPAKYEKQYSGIASIRTFLFLVTFPTNYIEKNTVPATVDEIERIAAEFTEKHKQFVTAQTQSLQNQTT